MLWLRVSTLVIAVSIACGCGSPSISVGDVRLKRPLTKLGLVVGEPNQARNEAVARLAQQVLQERSGATVALADVSMPRTALEAKNVVGSFVSAGCEAVLVLIPYDGESWGWSDGSSADTLNESFITAAFYDEPQRGFHHETDVDVFIFDAIQDGVILEYFFQQYRRRLTAVESASDFLHGLSEQLLEDGVIARRT